MKNRFLYLILLVVVVACQKEDSTSPELFDFKVNGVSDATLTLVQGSAITAQYSVSDDTALNQSKTAMSSGGIFYSEGPSSIFSPTNYGDWTDFKINELSGKSGSVNDAFMVPDTIDGYWTIAANVIDVTGNLTSYEKVVNVRNTARPQFYFTDLSPAVTGNVWEASAPQTVSLMGEIQDLTVVDSLFRIVRLSNTTVLSDTLIIYNSTYDLSGLSFPEWTAPGNYNISLRARNAQGKSTTVTGVFKLQ